MEAEASDYWVLRPVWPYFVVLLFQSFVFYVFSGGTGMALVLHHFSHSLIPLPGLVSKALLGVFSLGLGGCVILKLIEYRRIKYVFCAAGYRIEQGLTFTSEFDSYRQINNARLDRSIFEQILGCGTITLDLAGHTKKSRVFHYIRNYNGLKEYFENDVKKFHSAARAIISSS